MTTEEMVKAATALVRSAGLMGGDKRLPMVYVVHGKLCWFLMQAMREQYGTDYPIEELDIRSAWRIVKSREMTSREEDDVLWDFDNRGALFYDCHLFCDNPYVMVTNNEVHTIKH